MSKLSCVDDHYTAIRLLLLVNKLEKKVFEQNHLSFACELIRLSKKSMYHCKVRTAGTATRVN